MNFKLEQSELITQAVKEQLGIEEEEDYDDFEGDLVDQIQNNFSELDKIKFKMNEVERELMVKENYIHKLEKLLLDEIKRVDLLEIKFYEIKNSI